MEETRQKGQRIAADRVRATQVQISLRVAQIYAFLRDGRRTSEIYKLCAQKRAVESKARSDAREGKLDEKGVAIPEPLLVWGEEPLPSPRQLDEYIRKAKLKIAADGKELSTKGEYVLGVNWARINDLYARALADKKYHACVRLIQITNSMFGLEGVVKVQLLPPTAGAGEGESGAVTAKQLASMTTESAFLQLSAIASRALARAKLAGQLPADVSVEQILLGTPIRVIEAPTTPTPSPNGQSGR